jgi:hypothetical protein
LAEEPRRVEGSEPPPAGPPPFPGAAQTGMLVRALEDALVDPRKDITNLQTSTRTDFWRLLCSFAAGFVLLATMLVVGYHWLDDRIIVQSARLEDRIAKTDDRVNSLGSLLTRVDQKLQDLLDRIPPQPVAPPQPAAPPRRQ